MFNQLLNNWWWLTRAGLWGAYSQDIITWSHISSHSHRDIVNPIPIGYIGCFSLQPQIQIIFQISWRVLSMFCTHSSIILFLHHRKQVRDMDEKTLVHTIYIKVLKSTYNKRLSLTIDKLLYPFSCILPPYMCFHLQLHQRRLAPKMSSLQNKSTSY